jgi:predicted kinase
MKLAQILEAKEKPMAIFMMGAPGSGKSYYVDNNLQGLKVIDPDRINLKKFGNEGFHGGTLAKAFNIGVKQIEKAVANKRSFVFDSTAANPKTLQKIFDIVKGQIFSTKLIFMDVPVELAIAQNAGRTRHVPVPVIIEYHKIVKKTFKFAKTLGFDEVQVIKRKVVDESEMINASYLTE